MVAARQGNAQRIAALDRKATALGLSVGQPLANARAMIPALKVMAANAPADLKLLDRIADSNYDVLHQRVRVPAWEKTWVLVKSQFGA